MKKIPVSHEKVNFAIGESQHWDAEILLKAGCDGVRPQSS
jgi:hypothetical protein